MCDVNDQSHGQADGNVNGATKRASHGRGVHEGGGGAVGRLFAPVSAWRSSDAVHWPIDREDMPGHSRAAPLRGLGIAPNADHRFSPVHVVHVEHGPHISRS